MAAADCETQPLSMGAREGGTGFADKEIRRGFVQKVYGLLCCQLILTTIIAAPLAIHPENVNKLMGAAPWLMWATLAIFIGIQCLIMCAPHHLRTFPQNYAILFVFTACEGLFVGIISAQYKLESVALAAGLTAALCFGLTLFALQTKYDVTGMGPYLMCGLMALFLLGFIMMFLPGSPFLQKLYAVGGALLFSFYLVYDTQLIVGGKHKRANQFSIDDYILAALAIYVDVIQIFLMVLQMMGERR
mmetsp:Transcript_2743/g.6224  ORF Transcript_2743/g.6224 Transcript_2743/m.6224 type:complete len:246 (+) Transcript_2743:72-809(+)|eukprot:CAMPEP_0204269618 /NCGR_PEP_ID=MMETSP0468-20130131/16660_1 /ASSEMBLY_ACC=CAM_ASM_000383 /TAXON_ID=2969 /ORGANISM="Oxyrrhis marina" /LENGTH=245 /DNA_ID=CAMNT_0051245019 /DNA_START=71 /DNA_END=808 /DNA_ORIENTATION=-